MIRQRRRGKGGGNQKEAKEESLPYSDHEGVMCCCSMLIFMFNFLHIRALLSLNLRFNLAFCRIQVEVLLMAILDKKHQKDPVELFSDFLEETEFLIEKELIYCWRDFRNVAANRIGAGWTFITRRKHVLREMGYLWSCNYSVTWEAR